MLLREILAQLAALVATLAGLGQLGRITVLLAAFVLIATPYLANAVELPSASWDRATISYSMTSALNTAAGTPAPLAPEFGTPPVLWRLVWHWYLTALAIGIVVLLSLARLWIAAFTLLRAAVSEIITFDLQAIQGSSVRTITLEFSPHPSQLPRRPRPRLLRRLALPT